MRFRGVQHIIVDECNLIRGADIDEEWFALGKACALMGVKQSKEREKELKDWLETHITQLPSRSSDHSEVAEEGPAVLTPDTRQSRGGRKGIANATISIRKPLPQTVASSARASTSRTNMPKIRILPPPPTLLSLSTTNHTTASVEKHQGIREQFRKGWEAGLSQLQMTWTRLRASRANGVRIMYMAPRTLEPGSSEIRSNIPNSLSGTDPSMSEFLFPRMKGLIDLEDGHDVPAGWSDVQIQPPCPVLCLGGPDTTADHSIGCGHSFSQHTW